MSTEYLGMSDDDFLKINPDTSQETSEETPAVSDETPAAPATEEALDGATPVVPGSSESVVDPDKPADPVAPLEGTTPAAEVVPDPAAPAGDKPATEPKTEPKDPKTADPKAVSEAEAPDYEAFFKQIMTPFKANGRTVELKTPEEAIRLMQMGAGYGRKLQDMQPHLKTLKMLEKNNLLDEQALSYLIDIRNKNPDAIKKLIKDSGIDPLDLNVEDNVSYTPQNHAVSDKEMAFQNALDEVQSSPTGNQTLSVINQTWDQESKTVLWESPEVLAVIQTQRENGIYDQITAEIDRMKLLGHIPPTTPFLKAYKTAGDALVASGGFTPPPQATPATTIAPVAAQPQVIATRAAAPKAQVSNSDKARAASPTPTTPQKAATVINPLEMADDDFIKQFQGRF